jgi:uncharacterized repeat protein (TIGR03803 family)
VIREGGEEISMSKFNWGVRACGVLLLWATTAVALPAQTFTSLHSFDGTDGIAPQAALVQGTDGTLYGTTEYGGININITCFCVGCGTLYGGNGTCDPNGCGTVFSVTPSATRRRKTLYRFDIADGANPYGGLVRGTDGKFYGTTSFGGANRAGTVFRINASGTLKTLNNFDGMDGGGYNAQARLVQATNGDFYGTTASGGINAATMAVAWSSGLPQVAS